MKNKQKTYWGMRPWSGGDRSIEPVGWGWILLPIVILAVVLFIQTSNIYLRIAIGVLLIVLKVEGELRTRVVKDGGIRRIYSKKWQKFFRLESSISTGSQVRRALKQYRKYYEDPISVVAGEKVTWIRKDSEWTGWIWCIHPGTNKEGWVPENCVMKIGVDAEILKNYSAAELDAEPNEEFKILNDESGWYWCENSKGKQGWLPKKLFLG